MPGILDKERAAPGSRIIRLLVGNPVIMKKMIRSVPDAAAYAPVTILIDERGNGVHLSYDLMSGLIAPYGNPEALAIARDLDAKIVALLETAAAARGDGHESDKPDDPIAVAGSMAAADVMLMGVFLGDW